MKISEDWIIVSRLILALFHNNLLMYILYSKDYLRVKTLTREGGGNLVKSKACENVGRKMITSHMFKQDAQSMSVLVSRWLAD